MTTLLEEPRPLVEGVDFRNVRMTPELMDALVKAAHGNGARVDWGEPGDDGFYTPVIHVDDTYSYGELVQP